VTWGRLNGEFHLVLVGLARNGFITEQYRTLSFDHMHFQLARAADIEFTSLNLLVEQHEELIEALESGDKPLFMERLAQHINNLDLPG
jgi:DNA-binding GntR family transcriptional regulator